VSEKLDTSSANIRAINSSMSLDTKIPLLHFSCRKVTRSFMKSEKIIGLPTQPLHLVKLKKLLWLDFVIHYINFGKGLIPTPSNHCLSA
jgi:hypothetical protein